jgi:DNA primase
MASDLDITDGVLAELRSAADIVEVIGDHTRLKKAGRSWKGLCPFHQERTPSFTVDRDRGLYHCFGCGAGGDVIHFVRQIDRLDFPEAVEALASRFGVAIPRRQRRGPRDDRRDRLFEAVAAAQRFYAERLGRTGNRAADYLSGRGVPPELWKELGLGHAPDSWDALSRQLGGAYSEDLLVEAGLLQKRAEGKGAYDRFRDRLLFVVRDERGRPVGFGGRALSPEGEPKYLNSPESPIFSKKRLLYGLFEGREAIRRRDRVVLVEGYFDHLALLRAGVRETVASMGTALTPEQAERLRRLSPKAVLCYDGDAAGRAATAGALVHLLSQGFQVRVTRLPDGEDPDDLLQARGPEALAARIEEASDYLDWLLADIRPHEAELSPNEKRLRLQRILEILAAIPDRILRYEEHRRLSRAVSVPLELLWTAQPANRKGPETRSTGVGTSRGETVLSAREIPHAERALLQVLLHGGELNPLITKGLKDEWVTHEGVRRVANTLLGGALAPEKVDFRRRIAHLTDDEDLSLLSLVALEEGPEPTRQRALQVLQALETSFLERESVSLQAAIGRAEAEKRPQAEIDALLDRKQVMKRRIAQLKPSRKGNEVGD